MWTKATPQGLTELKAVPQADIPAGFEKHTCVKMFIFQELIQEELLLKSTKWPNGSVITVSLNGGTAKVRSKVMQYANEWSKYANITFKFITSGTAQIRVTFTQEQDLIPI